MIVQYLYGLCLARITWCMTSRSQIRPTLKPLWDRCCSFLLSDWLIDLLQGQSLQMLWFLLDTFVKMFQRGRLVGLYKLLQPSPSAHRMATLRRQLLVLLAFNGPLRRRSNCQPAAKASNKVNRQLSIYVSKYFRVCIKILSDSWQIQTCCQCPILKRPAYRAGP